MKVEYTDIRSRIDEHPDWFSDAGVPRYGEFEPGKVSVYSTIDLLLEISCQHCGLRMKYVSAWSPSNFFFEFMDDKRVNEFISEQGEVVTYDTEFLINFLPQPDGTNRGYWNVGDPPAHYHGDGEYCHAGCTMTAVIEEILQCWIRNSRNDEWERHPEHEYEVNYHG